jgi:glycosyltransferase involved in cell wall biosynthesis
MVPYKRVELVVEAFRRMPGRRLLVVGSGPNEAQARAAAAGAPNVEFRGRVGQAELVRLIGAARAFVFAAEEDFGIAMVEAQACGTPVIAFDRGGARDIVRPPPAPEPTGVLFPEQSAESVMAAVERFESLATPIVPEACRRNALRFSRDAFRAAMRDLVMEHLAEQQGQDRDAILPHRRHARAESGAL